MPSTLRIGWAQADITPQEPVVIAGQFHARVSEGVDDPLTVTALALESGGSRAVFVSCDLISISDEFRAAVCASVKDTVPDLYPRDLILHATHTHTGPETRVHRQRAGNLSGSGVDLPAAEPRAYIAMAAPRVAAAVARAWKERTEGRIAFGIAQTVVGRNRRWVDRSGRATMYGKVATRMFSHIEGWEDHSLNMMATYDPVGHLTGLVVNVPCPSQVSEHQFNISADYWCETREELRAHLGQGIFVLPQCSAAGDLSPRDIHESPAFKRMRDLLCRSERREIARRIAAAVEEVLPAIAPVASGMIELRHHCTLLDLPMNVISEQDAADATAEAEACMAKFEEERIKLAAHPATRNEPRWYVNASKAWRRADWLRGVAERYRRQREGGTWPAEIHVVRVGEIVFATNPFEYYVDFGAYVKANSPAVQTFLVQLAGAGTYVPSPRSAAAGGYGSVPASNPVGYEGGQILADHTLDLIQDVMRD